MESELVCKQDSEVTKLVMRLRDTLVEYGGTDKDLAFLNNDRQQQVVIDKAVSAALRCGRAMQTRQITYVDYEQSFETMSRLNGRRKVIHKDVLAARFPFRRKGKFCLRTVLYPVTGRMPTDEISQEMKFFGLRPATMAELFAYGACCRLPMQDVVVALGEVWEDTNINIQGVGYLEYWKRVQGLYVGIRHVKQHLNAHHACLGIVE